MGELEIQLRSALVLCWHLPAFCLSCSAGGERGWVMQRGDIDGVFWQMLSASGFTCKAIGHGYRGAVGHQSAGSLPSQGGIRKGQVSRLAVPEEGY